MSSEISICLLIDMKSFKKKGKKKNQPPTNMKTIQFSCFLKLINTGQTTKMGFFSSKTISQTSKKVLLKSCLGCTGIYQLYWYSGVKIAEGVKKKKKVDDNK